LISPYDAPASTFDDESIVEDSLRWRGALYFAVIPILLTILLEGNQIYSRSRHGPIYWDIRLIEPLLLGAPLCLLVAATGYAVAIKCLKSTIRSAMLLGCVVGMGWALFVIIAGNTIAQLNGAEPLTLDHMIRQASVIPAIFVSLAMVLCVFTRWRGVRLGLVSSQGN